MNTENWTLNESLLQSYRSIFITSQSILLATVGFTYEKDPILTFLIIAMAIFHLWIGFTAVKARIKIVDYHKFKLSSKYDNEGCLLVSGNTPLDVGVYLYESKVRMKINKVDKNFQTTNKMEKFYMKFFGNNWRLTRVKIDIFIPVSFLIIWLYILIFKVPIKLFLETIQTYCQS